MRRDRLGHGAARAGSSRGVQHSRNSSVVIDEAGAARPWLNYLSTFAIVPFVGGLMVRTLALDVHDPHSDHLTQSVTFALIVFGVFIVTVVLNFILIALHKRICEGRPLMRQVRELFLPRAPRPARRRRARDAPRGRLHERRPADAHRLDRGASDLAAAHRGAAALRGPCRPTRSALDPTRLPAARACSRR